MKITGILALLALLAALVVLAGCSSSGSSGSGSSPNLTKVALLANSGDSSALTEVRTQTLPYQGCDRPNYYATVDPSITGRTLAADELAYFKDQGGLTQPKGCPSYLYVFHTGESTTGDDGYSAGAIMDEDGGLTIIVGGTGSSPMFTYPS